MKLGIIGQNKKLSQWWIFLHSFTQKWVLEFVFNWIRNSNRNVFRNKIVSRIKKKESFYYLNNFRIIKRCVTTFRYTYFTLTTNQINRSYVEINSSSLYLQIVKAIVKALTRSEVLVFILILSYFHLPFFFLIWNSFLFLCFEIPKEENKCLKIKHIIFHEKCSQWKQHFKGI